MAKFFGKVGYGETEESPPDSGVHKLVITEVDYYGDVVRNGRNLEVADKVNSDITVDASISIVADQYMDEHFFAIRYVLWNGVRWTVSNVDVQRPRLILRLGKVYNGPTP